MGSSTLDVVAYELARQFPQQTFEDGHPTFESAQQSYWSGIQRELRPRCFFQPHSAAELARAVVLCVRAQCLFGVKSGGHAHVSGASCIDGGVQFDLVKLNTITIDRNKNVAVIGAGNTWRRVYRALEREGLIAVGGRSADVGVGGFLIGGGISFYAAEHGWGIDNVRSFEVVLGTGAVVTASRDSEPDLFRALRGGGSNFGIITAYELDIRPYHGMWGGRTLIDSIHSKDAIEAYADFIPKLDVDPKGHTIIIFDYLDGQVMVRQYMVYTEPKKDLPIFDRLRNVPTIESSLGITDYSTLAADIAELQEGHGYRHAVSTLTVKLDKELLEFTYDTYVQYAATVSQYAAGCLEFHALPRTPNSDDNMYGLKESDRPLISIMLAFSTASKRYDSELLALQQRILDVIGSYGDSNVKFLSQVLEAYDPQHVFQHLKPGGFKVDVSLRKSQQ